MLTISSAIRPAVVASAASSKGLIVSKNFSTLAAVLVFKPKSSKFAPKEKNPSGILNTPDAMPDNVDLMIPISSSSLLEESPTINPESFKLAIDYILLML